MYTIYGLVCPITYYIRYIGVTSKHTQVRLDQHMQCKDGCLQKVQWLKTLIDLDLIPSVVILGYAKDREQAYQTEKSWVIQGFSFGWPLTNGTDKNSEQDDTKTYAVPPSTRDTVVIEKLKLRDGINKIVRDVYGCENKGPKYKEATDDIYRIIAERIN